MNTEFETLLKKIVANNQLHALWLNTLSLMENCGSKKISRCQHPIFVSEIILKHAAEESRHGYYLKKQIRKVAENACSTYEKKYLLAPSNSYYYLHELDIAVSRFLKQDYFLTGQKLKYAAYLLVTFAIEVRADEMYPIYQKVLDEAGSKVNVKSIIAEEIGHLAEMNKAIDEFFDESDSIRKTVKDMEEKLFNKWRHALENEVLC